MRERLAGAIASIVRMLCSRSASLIRMTRTSRAIASSILRNDSACDSSRVENCSLSSLVRPSTRSATDAPKRSISSRFFTPQSSMTSCISAAMMACASSRHSAQRPATAIGCVMYGLAARAKLTEVRLVGETVRLANLAQFGGVEVVEPDG